MQTVGDTAFYKRPLIDTTHFQSPSYTGDPLKSCVPGSSSPERASQESRRIRMVRSGLQLTLQADNSGVHRGSPFTWGHKFRGDKLQFGPR